MAQVQHDATVVRLHKSHVTIVAQDGRDLKWGGKRGGKRKKREMCRVPFSSNRPNCWAFTSLLGRNSIAFTDLTAVGNASTRTHACVVKSNSNKYRDLANADSHRDDWTRQLMSGSREKKNNER